MARIPDELLRCVVYIYPSVETAEAGTGTGGTGFLVERTQGGQRGHFVVTNHHVVLSGGRFIRVNTTEGHVEVAEIPVDTWVAHESGDDVAAARLTLKDAWDLAPLDLEACYGDRARFDARLTGLNVGVGDDVLMIGRFIGHDGRERNQPLARPRTDRIGLLTSVGPTVRTTPGVDTSSATSSRGVAPPCGGPSTSFAALGPGPRPSRRSRYPRRARRP